MFPEFVDAASHTTVRINRDYVVFIRPNADDAKYTDLYVAAPGASTVTVEGDYNAVAKKFSA